MSVGLMTIVPSLALAAEVVVEPEVETWVMDQSVPGVDVEGDVVVGGRTMNGAST